MGLRMLLILGARVTILVLSVCVCVCVCMCMCARGCVGECLSLVIFELEAKKQYRSDTNSISASSTLNVFAETTAVQSRLIICDDVKWARFLHRGLQRQDNGSF